MSAAKALVVILLLSCSLSAQNKINVFPQVADGIFSADGTSYTSTFMITPWFETSAAITCTLRLQGLSVNINSFGRASVWNITIPANGGYFVGVTAADQA